jgi:hypothetical protein
VITASAPDPTASSCRRQAQVEETRRVLRVVDAFGNSGSAVSRPGRRYLTAGTRTRAHAALVMRDHGRREARDEYVQ